MSSDASRGEWFDAIDEEARRVAGVLAGSFDDSEPLRTYKYSIREIIRNVFEHSQVSECFIFAQRWPDGSAEIAIVDEGVGIAHTLAQSHGAKTDAESLQLAVQPGVSRTSGGTGEDNIYENSGFGLYVLSELAASFGWFMLGSGSAALFGQKRTRVVGEVPFHGTFFSMKLLSTPSEFRSVLRDIIETGEREASVGGIEKRASGRTRIVT